MKQKDREELQLLRKKYGKSMNRFIRTRRNYPFGIKSEVEIKFEKRR